jgi:hypothetical protein
VPIYPVTLITQAAPRPRVTKAKVTVPKKPTPKRPKKVKEKPVTVKKPKPNQAQTQEKGPPQEESGKEGRDIRKTGSKKDRVPH